MNIKEAIKALKNDCRLGIWSDSSIEAIQYFEQLEKENQELKEKLNIDFEDSADELCEALTERDKLYDEKLELQKENEELKQYKDILEEYGLDLESPKIREVLICGMMYKDYRKAIKILKDIVGVNSIVIYAKKRYIDVTQKQLEIVKEVFENEGDSDE